MAKLNDTTINGTLKVLGTTTLDIPLLIANGGTGATTVADARNNLEITPANIGAVPDSRIINGKSLSADISLTASDIGAAASSHNHDANNITSGTLPIARGGTGATSAADVRSNLGFGGKVLWSGGMYMNDSQSATLSEAVSVQPNGIVLAFSWYDGTTAQDWNWHSFFVSKKFIELKNGNGIHFPLFTTTYGVAANKYLYIFRTEIKGNANNTSTGTGTSGVKYTNTSWVLRYVLGV